MLVDWYNGSIAHRLVKQTSNVLPILSREQGKTLAVKIIKLLIPVQLDIPLYTLAHRTTHNILGLQKMTDPHINKYYI